MARKGLEKNILSKRNPVLAKEWHPTKNGKITPDSITVGSDRKVWWKCSKGHEWEASIGSRNKGSGCPYCAGRRVSEDNCLAIINPELAKEWHLNKNKLTPFEIIPGSTKKVWWRCTEGHEWEAIVHTRHNGKGCPYCAGRRVSEDNCLATLNPKLAGEWHLTKMAM